MIQSLRNRRQRIIDYKAAFSTHHGERVLKDLICLYVMKPSFDKDPHVTSMREGARTVVLRIMSMMNLKPEDLEEIVREELSNEHAD